MAINGAREGYARLPEDLLQDLLMGARDVAAEVAGLLGSGLDARSELRAALHDLNLIYTIEGGDLTTVAAVDGGFAVERTAAVDLLLSVAVGVEGLATETTPWGATQYEWYAKVSAHDSDSERLLRGTMVSQELAILAGAPHALKILDGSHLTLVIQLNSGLTAFSEAVRDELQRIWSKLGLVESLGAVCRDASVVAMPKYDSSRSIVEILEHQLGRSIPGDDKHLMAIVLEAGEYIRPQRVPAHPWSTLHFTPRSQREQPIAAALEAAIAPLRERDIEFTYFRATEDSPAFRIEFKRQRSEAFVANALATTASQLTGPFVREPYPQYLADVMAKSVGVGLSALQTAVQLDLAASGRPEIAELLLHSYRTEGV